MITRGEFILVSFVILVNILADTFINIFPLLGLIRGGVDVAFIIYFVIYRMEHNRISHTIIMFVLLLFILTLFSSRFMDSFMSGFIKWFVSLMMFMVGHYYIKTFDNMYRFTVVIIIGAFIINSNLLWAQIAGVGFSPYAEDSFYLGGASVGIPNLLAIIIIISPIFYLKKNRSTLLNIVTPIILVMCFVFVVLAMKRAALLALGAGLITYIYYSPRKLQIIKYLSIISIFLLMSLPLYQETLVKQYEARTTEKNELQNEARYHEFFYVLDEYSERSPLKVLFGEELFNAKQFFGVKYFGRERMIHGDFSNFLYGSGIVGVFLYIYILGLIFITLLRLFRPSKVYLPAKVMFTSFIGVFIGVVLISATGSGTIGERTVCYMFFGGVISILKQYRNTSNPLSIEATLL